MQLFDTLIVTFNLEHLFTEWYKNQKKLSRQKKIVTRFARATVTKSFHMTSRNTSITGLRKASQTLLESIALSSHSYSRASKCLESAR